MKLIVKSIRDKNNVTMETTIKTDIKALIIWPLVGKITLSNSSLTEK